MSPRIFAGLLCTAGALLVAGPVHADCCQVVKVDTDTPSVTVRVCDDAADGGCATVLFEGTLQVGQSQQVCSQGNTLLYEEWDPTQQAYEPAVTAVCQGGDVEL